MVHLPGRFLATQAPRDSRLELPWSWPSPALEGTELQRVVAAKRRRLAWELQRLETVMPGRRGPGVGDSGDLNGK